MAAVRAATSGTSSESSGSSTSAAHRLWPSPLDAVVGSPTIGSSN